MTVDVSKLLGYAVLTGETLDVSKLVSYVVLVPGESFELYQSGIHVVAYQTAPVEALQSGAHIIVDQTADDTLHQSGAHVVATVKQRPFNWVLPEEPIEEVWRWNTDIITSDNGTEQRISLRTTPRVELTHRFALDNNADLRKVFRALWSDLGKPVPMPHWQYKTKLQTVTAAGQSRIYFDPKKTNIRAGGYCFIEEGNTFQILRVKTILSDGARLYDTVGPVFSTAAFIMPLTYHFVSSGAGMRRVAPDTFADLQLTGLDSATIAPLTNPEVDPVTLPTCDGYAIFDRRPVGSSFEQAAVSGASLVDLGPGVTSYMDPWKRGDLNGARTVRLSRMNGRSTSAPDVEWFRTFADYCKGSAVPFLAPTWRPDFDLVSAVAGASTLTLSGTEYAEYYFRHVGWRFIALETASGLVVRRVDAVAVSGGDSVLTLQEALPDPLEAVLKVMLAPLSRIGDDTMSLVHFAWHSEATFSIRTTDE